MDGGNVDLRATRSVAATDSGLSEKDLGSCVVRLKKGKIGKRREVLFFPSTASGVIGMGLAMAGV